MLDGTRGHRRWTKRRVDGGASRRAGVGDIDGSGEKRGRQLARRHRLEKAVVVRAEDRIGAGLVACQ